MNINARKGRCLASHSHSQAHSSHQAPHTTTNTHSDHEHLGRDTHTNTDDDDDDAEERRKKKRRGFLRHPIHLLLPPHSVPLFLTALTTRLWISKINPFFQQKIPMEKCAYRRGREIPSPNASSPNSSTTSSSSSSSNGASLPPKAAAAPLANASSAPVTPKSIPRTFDANPYPTTFIQADTSSFKQVVQMLTGSAETTAKHAVAATSTAPKSSIPPSGKPTGPKKPAFKLYERRGSMKSLKMINPMIPSFAGRSNPNSPVTAFSPRKLPEILSPSMLDLPSLALSPVTPLFPDPFDRDAFMAEERAIAEKGFYFHPSRRMTPRDAEPPRLLPLFPVSSPEISSSSST